MSKEVMDYTGWWCEKCGLTKYGRDDNCTTCGRSVIMVPTKILTEQSYKELEEVIVELKKDVAFYKGDTTSLDEARNKIEELEDVINELQG